MKQLLDTILEDFRDQFKSISGEEHQSRLEQMSDEDLRDAATEALENLTSETLYYAHAWIPSAVDLYIIAIRDISEYLDKENLISFIQSPDGVTLKDLIKRQGQASNVMFKNKAKEE